MKKLIILSSFCLFALHTNAQVAIGKTSVSNTNVSLEFGTGNRGIILPWVTAAANVTNVVNGTLIYDTTDKKVKVKYNSGWKDLSNQAGAVDTSLQSSKTEQANAKMSIGTPTATAGILILEDTNKAMILPKVSQPHINIINPAAGMVVYDTNKKQLVVYNGTVWTFWKASP